MPSLDKFKLPKLLLELDKLAGDPGLWYLGIDRVHSDCRWLPYAQSPPDFLQFAWTGGDGIHFGFLTDFGTVTDLGKAPIVCSHPTGLTLVAKNLRDFVRALCLVKDGDHFSDFAYHTKKSDPWWTTFGVDTTDEQYADTIRTARIVKERLDLDEIPDYHAYLASLWAERKKNISLETKDGLGILRTARSSPEPEETFDFSAKKKKPDLKKMRAFVARASHDATLAFCKDCQYHFDFRFEQGDEVRHLVADALCGLGYDFEGKRVRTWRSKD
jgi:hypothetical protein